jgi:hypothetical protein
MVFSGTEGVLIESALRGVFLGCLSRRELAYHDCIMTKAKNPIPEGFHTLTPHITVNGAVKYIDFLKRAFRAVEVSRSPGQAGKLMHAHVRIGDSDLMFNDPFRKTGRRQ